MSDVREVRMEKDQRAERAAGGKREVRWSARRKEEVVLRLLRGESLDALARECGQPAAQLSAWREDFLAAGREGLKSRPRPEEDRRLAAAQRKVGEFAVVGTPRRRGSCWATVPSAARPRPGPTRTPIR